MSVPSTASSSSSNSITINTEIVVGLPKKTDILYSLREILYYNTTHTLYIDKYQLSKESIQIIQTLLQDTPKLFLDIAKELNEIMEDGKFDSHDIPHIIKIIKDIVQMNSHVFSAIGIMNSVSISQFIRTLFILLIESQYIWIPHNAQVAILRNIDASIDLLVSTLHITDIKMASCFSFCKPGCLF